MSYRKLQLWIHREKDEVSLTSSLVITRSNEIRAQMCDGNIAWSQHTRNEKTPQVLSHGVFTLR